MEFNNEDMMVFKEKIEYFETEISKLKEDNINLKKELAKQNEKNKTEILEERTMNLKKEIDNLHLATTHNIKQLFKRQVMTENYIEVTQVNIEEIGKELNDLQKKIKKDTIKLNEDLHKIEERFNMNQNNFKLHTKKLNALFEFKERSNTIITNIQSKLETIDEKILNKVTKKDDKKHYKSLENKVDTLEKNQKHILDLNTEDKINNLIDFKMKKILKDINDSFSVKISKREIEKVVRNELNDIISKSILEIQDNINIDKILRDNKKVLMNEIRQSISLTNSSTIKQYSESIKNIIDKFRNVQKNYDVKFDVVENKFKQIEESTVEIKTNLQKEEVVVKKHIDNDTKKEINNDFSIKELDNIKIRISQIETQLIHQMNILLSQNHMTPHYMTQPYYIPQHMSS